MKYFVVAVIFGLFAISQAAPVQDENEKRFFLGNLIPVVVNKGLEFAKELCEQSVQPGEQPLGALCGCLDAAGHIGGIIGGLGDESPKEKRFLFGPINVGQVIEDIVREICENPAPGLIADKCKCASGLLNLG